MNENLFFSFTNGMFVHKLSLRQNGILRQMYLNMIMIEWKEIFSFKLFKWKVTKIEKVYFIFGRPFFNYQILKKFKKRTSFL